MKSLEGGAEGHIERAIRDGLQSSGYAYLKEALLLEQLETILARIGTVRLRSDIVIDSTKAALMESTRKVKNRPNPGSEKQLDFHCDNPSMDLACWYCVEQDDVNGDMLLLDTADIATFFTAEDLAVLGSTLGWFPGRLRYSDDETFFREPIVSVDNRGYRVHYVPWVSLDSPTEEQVEAFRKLSLYVEQKKNGQVITIPIEKSQCLLIDNHRMLHGRKELRPDSKRHLVRFLVQMPDVRR